MVQFLSLPHIGIPTTLQCGAKTKARDGSRDRISNHPRFVSGELDMDGLCSELRSKAKCSETGVVVAETDVQEVLTKAGVAHKDILG